MKLHMVRFGWPTPETPYNHLHLQVLQLYEDDEFVGVTGTTRPLTTDARLFRPCCMRRRSAGIC